jgi:hypothetical protein
MRMENNIMDTDCVGGSRREQTQFSLWTDHMASCLNIMENYKFIGFCKGHSDTEIIRLPNDDNCIALSGWNGEIYSDCWTCTESGYPTDVRGRKFSMKPIMQQIGNTDDYETTSFAKSYL